MNAQEAYQHFGTPKGLQDHMLTVAGLAQSLQVHWVGDVIDWDAAAKAALLHDIGNVIKFDLDNFPQLLGAELPRLEYWRAEQRRLIEQYGADEHAATDKMLDELRVSESVREAIQAKSFGNAKETAASDNWLVKILFYCDMRVLPHGVGPLDERIADIKARLKKYADWPDFPELADACRAIEQQIQSAVSAPLDTVITQAKADENRKQLLEEIVS